MQIIYLRNNNTGDLKKKGKYTHILFYFTCKFDWYKILSLQNFNYHLFYCWKLNVYLEI